MNFLKLRRNPRSFFFLIFVAAGAGAVAQIKDWSFPTSKPPKLLPIQRKKWGRDEIAMADSRSFGYSSGDNPDDRQQPGRRIYDPYKDLQIPYRAIYDIPTSPEFLFQEESVAQRRSWGENLTYYTGIGYLGGAVGGASVGLYKGLRSAEPGDTVKLRISRVLNSSGQDGRRFGNRLGAIGLLYAGMESGLVAVRDSDDWINSVVAGLGTGALFKAANGPRSAAIAGAIGGLMVGAAMAGKQVLKRYVPI